MEKNPFNLRGGYRTVVGVPLAGAVLWASGAMVSGFGVRLQGGYAERWDAAEHLALGFGEDRSLSDGKLSYAFEGGSAANLYDLIVLNGGSFTDGTTRDQLGGIVEEAFGAWTAEDPATGYDAPFTFEFDSDATANTNDQLSGAEIDIGLGPWDFSGAARGFTFRQNHTTDGYELTSGVAVATGKAIAGADILLNMFGQWTADSFRLVLVHEIGIALGLVDVDVTISDVSDPRNGLLPLWYDDNYSGDDQLATMTNSWADLIDPFDPEGTVGMTGVDFGTNGSAFDLSGVDFVMETTIPAGLLGNLSPLSTDEYAARQFLYPVVVPEQSTFVFALFGFAFLFRRRRG